MKIHKFESEKLNNKIIEHLNYSTHTEDTFVAPLGFCSYKIKHFIIPDIIKEITNTCIDPILKIDTLEANGVEIIKKHAFKKSNIKRFDFSKSNLRKIDIGAFCSSSIENIKFPATVTCIDAFVFKETKLKKIILPENLDVLGKSCFEDCKNLEEVILPKNFTWLENDVFANCKNLKTVTFPNYLQYFASTTFANCNKLETLIFPESIGLDSIEFILENKSIKNSPITNIVYEGKNKEIIEFLEELCFYKEYNLKVNSLDFLLKNNKSFKEINKTYKKIENIESR